MKLILTDIDDTVLQFANAFEAWAVQEKGYTLTQSIRFGGSIQDAIGCHRDVVDDLIIEFSTNPSFFGVIPPEDDALAVIPVLHKMGYEFAAISSCVDGPEVTEVRRKNLEEAFGIPWLDVHCAGLMASKVSYLSKFDSAYWVEDNSGHACVGAAMGHKTFLLERAYNLRAFHTGWVKWYDPERGHGMIVSDEGGGPIFAFERNLVGMESIQQDQKVSFQLEHSEGGKYHAVNIQSAPYLKKVKSWHDVLEAVVRAES